MHEILSRVYDLVTHLSDGHIVLVPISSWHGNVDFNTNIKLNLVLIKKAQK